MPKNWVVEVKGQNGKKAEYTFDDKKLISQSANLNGVDDLGLFLLIEAVTKVYRLLRDNDIVSLESKEIEV